MPAHARPKQKKLKASPPCEPELAILQENILINEGKVVSKSCLINVTPRCNQECLFCPIGKAPKDTSTALLHTTLDDYCARNAETINITDLSLTGGEATLSPALLKFVRTCKSRGFRMITLLTNGVRLADPRFAQALLDAGVGQLFISMHSHIPSVYDRLTGTKGQHSRALQGVRNALALPFPGICINAVITRHNYKGLPAWAAFLAKLKARVSAGANLELFISVMTDNPRWNELCVSHSQAAPYFLRASKVGIRMAKLVGACAMPICIDGLEKKAPEMIPEIGLVPLNSQTLYSPEIRPKIPEKHFPRVKIEGCRECVFDANCTGVSTTYARKFGLGELRPIRRAILTSP